MNKRCIIIASICLLVLLAPFAILHAQENGTETHMVEAMTTLVLQVGIIIFAAKMGGAIFNRFKLPVVLGELMAGVIIGPYLFGSLPLLGFAHGIFPLNGAFPVSRELYSIATIASIILLFLVGLETNIDAFLSFSVTGSLVGLFGVVGSFVLGDLAAVIFSRYVFGVQYVFTDSVPLFLGIISTATSVGITARILSEKKKMDSPEGITIISAAVIDDVLGIIALAIVIGMCKSGNIAWKKVGIVSLKAIAIWLGFTLIGLTFSRFISRLLKRVKDKAMISILSFALALLLAGVFERSGLAMIIGAYIMGLSLSKTDLSFVIQGNLSVLQKFFVPIFFCVMGMLVNLKEIASFKIFTFGMIYLVFAILGKMIGCGLPALFCNFNLRGAARVGVGMIPRGEVALIIAGIGLSANIIPHDIFSVSVMMTFITTLVAPPILAGMLDSKKPVLKKEQEVKTEHIEIQFTMPNIETSELILRKVIEAFEREKFYIYFMEIPEKLYQIRKDQIFITLKYTPQSLVFNCLEQDASFIHTLFYEVLAELEYIIKRLGALPDREKIGKKIFDNKSHVKNGDGGFSHVINELTVEANLKGKTKKDILKELIDILVKSGQLEYSRKDKVLADLVERESIMSTGMQDGIALPHAKTNEVPSLVSAVGVKREGVDFNSLDKKPSTIFVITLVPREFSQPYLQYMAEVARFLMNNENRRRILSCNRNEELYNILTSKE